MAASKTTRSIPAWAKTAGRAVHIKIHPQPRNLAESRGILHMLQEYGEVIMYKHLKVILNTFIHCPQLDAKKT